jgi:hypothetical protein
MDRAAEIFAVQGILTLLLDKSSMRALCYFYQARSFFA